MRICHCHDVSDRSIRACALESGCTVGAVARCTRAGTGCGGCVPAIRDIVETLRIGANPGGITDRSLPLAALPLAALPLAAE